MSKTFEEEWAEAISYLAEKRSQDPRREWPPSIFEIYDTVEKLRLAKSMVQPKRCPGKDYG